LCNDFQDPDFSDDVPDVVEGGLLQEQLILNEDPHQWLQHMCNDACAKGALQWVQLQESAGSNKSLLVMPACCPETCSLGVHALQRKPDQQKARLCPFVFLELHLMSFGDEECFVSCCSNPGCDCDQDARDIFSQQFDVPECPAFSYEAIFGAASPLCNCALAAITSLWGSVGDPDLPDEGSLNWCYFAQEPGSATLFLTWLVSSVAAHAEQ
jgi:hypothetical protein